MYNDYFDVRDRYLEHYGVKGMKWRFTKFTNKIRKGGRDIYEYANRKATYYGGQARRELNKAKRVVRKGMKSFGNNVSKSLSRAYHNVKARYNPGALFRRAKRSYDIYKLNQRTANINKAHKSQNAMANDARYRVNSSVSTKSRAVQNSPAAKFNKFRNTVNNIQNNFRSDLRKTGYNIGTGLYYGTQAAKNAKKKSKKVNRW